MTKQTEERVDKLVQNAADEEKRKIYREMDGFEMIWVFTFITENDQLSHEDFKEQLINLFRDDNTKPKNYKSILKVLELCVL